MKKALSIFALIFLTACTSMPSERTISWTIVDTREELQIICNTKSLNVVGCYRDGGVVCRVYTLKNDPEEHDTLGHEVKHCFQGRFHK